MESLTFAKYEGAGNDFIAIDNTASEWNLTTGQLQRMCNRKTGIGADGVLEVRLSQVTDCCFRLVYYNADGREGSLCGNGMRCSLAFAHSLGVIRLAANQNVSFEACDGVHRGGILDSGQYFVDMRHVALADVRHLDDGDYFLDTGSPHHVTFIINLAEVDVVGKGRAIRWGTYGDVGANVNFVEADPSDDYHLTVRTFERGVEDETLACGTGACASAIAAYIRHQKLITSARAEQPVTTAVSMKGGELEVRFKCCGHGFTDIMLCGPARHVFDGKLHVMEM